MPRMLTDCVSPASVIESAGEANCRSESRTTALPWSCSPLIAVAAIGTSWRFSERRCEVITTSCSVSTLEDVGVDGSAVCAAAVAADHPQTARLVDSAILLTNKRAPFTSTSENSTATSYCGGPEAFCPVVKAVRGFLTGREIQWRRQEPGKCTMGMRVRSREYHLGARGRAPPAASCIRTGTTSPTSSTYHPLNRSVP